MFIRDQAAVTAHEVTPEGFLRLRAHIGRTGLHDYRAAEIGAPAGFAPEDTVRVYRPPDEVFDPASMASFGGKPVTDGHPPTMVDAANWRRFAIGHAGEGVAREGDHLAASLHIADQAAAERARAGAELSSGYHAEFDFEPGLTPDGEPYDAVQRNIRGNHVALVDAGRCGPSCGTAQIPAGDCACGPAAPAFLDAAALDALVEDRMAVIDTARRLLGPTFRPDGLPTADLRRLVVGRRLGPERIAARDDAYVAAAFDALAAIPPATNPLAAHLATGRPGGGGREAALLARDRFLTDAWKGVPHPETR